ncbi:MAG: carbamoyltransferase family protein [Gammaproteobacteria bacterium]
MDTAIKTYYLGLSVTYHDPALAIIDAHGKVLFAEATERFLQHKRALNCPPDTLLRLPELLADYCPAPGAFVIAINWRKQRPWYEQAVSRLGVLSAPGLLKTGIKKLRSPLQNYQLHHMIACQRYSIAQAGLNLVRIIHERYPASSIRFADFDHHLTHAATACYSSPFEDAACAVIDSFGERGALAFYRFAGRRLQLLHENRGSGSLGFLYMKITELCGFEWLHGEEWKVMGLAPYGKLNPALYELLSDIVRIDGFRCRHNAPRLFKKIAALQRFKRRQDEPIIAAADVAYTGQHVFAEKLSELLRHLHAVSGCGQLAFGGGCALNSAFNGQIAALTPFKQVHIPSAPADDGTALGAAWLALLRDRPDALTEAKTVSPYLGSELPRKSIERLSRYHSGLHIRHCPQDICAVTARLLAGGKLVGWVQGRAEFGPRALGNRSILADPRDAAMQDKINRSIKFREAFRPFAPSILAEHADDYFENCQPSPYMDKTLRIRPGMRERIAAVCHVDGTGRLQTVDRDGNPRFHELLSRFQQITHVPVLLNTSFNVMGKPLVHTLEDALAVFMTGGLDALAIGDYLIVKEADINRSV